MHIQLCLSLDFYLFYLLLDSCDKKDANTFSSAESWWL